MRCAAFLLALGSFVMPILVDDGHAADQPTRQPTDRPTRQLGTGDQPVLFNADEVQYDQELGLVVAKGNVELDQGGQTLLADTVTYNQRTDTVTASGHVSLLQPSGDIVFGDFVELHNDMRDGFIKDMRLLLSDRSRMAGNTARRVGGTRTEIRRAVYSPCELCQSDPTQPPVWQIKAAEAVHDKELQIVEYRDAIMEIDGIPVLYAPYFSHPDPSVKRQSGFLPPAIGYGNTLGAHTSIPYYWVIAPDKDATFSPLFTTSAGVVLAGQYRQRFSNGETVDNASVEAGSGRQSASSSGTGPPSGSVRWDMLGTGEWDIDPNLRTGFQAQRASDQTYLLRYHFPSPTNFLTSHVFAENFQTNSYGNLSGFAFQSLNPGAGDGQQPIVLPTGNFVWTGDPDRFGGQLEFAGNALNLFRRTGPEIRRVSGGSGWQLPFNGPVGDRFLFQANVRADGYYSDHVALTPNFITIQNSTGTTIDLLNNAGTSTELAGRVFPQVALQWRYPWVRSGANGNALIEPIAALIAGPNGGNPAKIPNEDSQAFEFDETSLFVPNRLPGYDRVDSGQRVDYGIHAEYHTEMLGSFDTLVGQSYRAETSDTFQPGSGVNDRLSDIVGRIGGTPNKYLNYYYRFRVDKSDFAARRQEAGISAGPASFRVGLSYIAISPGAAAANSPAGNQIGVNLDTALTRYWSASFNDTRFIGGTGETINSGASLTYRDDCFAVVTSITQSGIRVGDVRPGVSVMLTLVFKNLGEISERVLSAN